MVTLNTNLIPKLKNNGIRFRYIGDVYNPITIIVTHKHLDICRVDMNCNPTPGEPYNYYVYWFPSIVKNTSLFKRKYLISQELIDDIRKVIYPKLDEIIFTVNVLHSHDGLKNDWQRIRDAVESIGDTNESYSKKFMNNYYGGFTTWRNEYQKERDKFDIKDVIFNNPATIVFWEDGTKTVVKAENEEFDPEKGLAMAITKKALGNNYGYYDVFKKYVGRYEKKQKKGEK